MQHVAYKFKTKNVYNMLLMNLNENIDLQNNSFSFLHQFFCEQTVISSLEGFSMIFMKIDLLHTNYF